MRSFDIVVIGGGAGGLSAAQYGARANRSTLLLDRNGPGGQCTLISELENYPGIPEVITGEDFTERFVRQAEHFGAVIETGSVGTIRPADGLFILDIVDEDDGEILESVEARTVILATGAAHRRLGIPREEELTGRGVSYCATCDGPMFRDKTMVVVGGGDAAFDEATFLSKLTERVILVHRRDRFRAQGALVQRVRDNPRIELRTNTVVDEILTAPNHFGIDAVSGLRLRDVVTGEVYEQSAEALFVFIGSDPVTGLVPFVDRDTNGYVITDEHMESSLPGLYAVGDVRATPFRQLIVAAADGAIAAHAASQRVAAYEESSVQGIL